MRCLALTLALLGCVAETSQPARPDGVPAEAMWIGGVDGGVFVDLEPPVSKNSFQGVVYYESTGEVWFRGEFVLEPRDSGEVVVDDPQPFSAWDGERLFLTDGRSLVAKGASD